AACTGQDGDRESLVRTEPLERLLQRVRRLRIDGVSRLRPVDGDGEHRPIDLRSYLTLAPPIPVGVFATGPAHPRVAACASVLAHRPGALRSGARGAFGSARPIALPLPVAG